MYIIVCFTDDFNCEDIADALVTMSVNDTVHTIFKTCVETKVKRVFVCGSYANREIMREKFTHDWETRRNQGKMMGNLNVSIN